MSYRHAAAETAAAQVRTPSAPGVATPSWPYLLNRAKQVDGTPPRLPAVCRWPRLQDALGAALVEPRRFTHIRTNHRSRTNTGGADLHQILGFRRRGYRTTLAPSANRRLEIPCEAAGKANHWMLGRLWGGFAAPDRGWRWAPLLLFLATVTYWVFAERAADKYPNYMSNEATVVLRTPPAALLGPLVMPDQPDYQVFYPLGYNLLVAVDRFIIAPIALGPQATDPGV